MSRSARTAAMAALVMTLLSGCVPAQTPEQPSAPASSRPSAPNEPGDAASAPGMRGGGAAVRPLTPKEKRSLIASSFPLEVPAPDGEYTRAKAQGDEAWDYTVAVTTAPGTLLEWYLTVYSAAQWTITDEGDFDRDGEAGRFLEFRKGNAQSSVYVDEAVDEQGRSTARVVLGVGTPVLDTQ